MKQIRQASTEDLVRIAEIEVFNYRLNFYPIFRSDWFYFQELQVPQVARKYANALDSLWVYDDGVVKGFVQTENGEVRKIFVEPVLQGESIGAKLLEVAVAQRGARCDRRKETGGGNWGISGPDAPRCVGFCAELLNFSCLSVEQENYLSYN